MSKIESISIIFGFLAISVFSTAQVAVGQWQDHISYNSGKQILIADETVYMLSQSGILKYNTTNEEIEKLTKINCLSDGTPSQIGYDTQNKYIIVGYSNGNLDLIKNNKVVNINDIKRKSLNSSKSINAIYVKNNLAYLGCDFGVVVLDILKKEIKETWLVGKNGAYVKINAMDSDGENLYLATNKGIFKGNFNDALVDFSKWEILTDTDTISSISWMKEANYNTLKWFQNKLIVNYKSAEQNSDTIMQYSNNEWTHAIPNRLSVKSLCGSNDTLICCTNTAAYLYDSNLNQIKEIWWYYAKEGTFDTKSQHAALYKNKIWIADNEQGLVYVENWWAVLFSVNSPKSNDIFDFASTNSKLIAVNGGYNVSYTPSWLKPRFYIYSENTWNTFGYKEFPEFEGSSDFVRVCIDPKDEKHYFLSSWTNGLFEFRNNTFYKHYTDANSTLKKIDGTDYIRIGATAFDNDGNLWVTNSLSSDCIHTLSPQGDWTSLPYPNMNKNISRILISKSGIKWILIAYNGGIFVFDDNGTPETLSDDRYKHIDILDEDGELVSNDVYSIAEDQNGYIWVGTAQGIVVYYNPDKIFDTGVVTGKRVKVPRNDGTENADLLLSTDVVTSICVDGANNKWFGTRNGGAYHTSADGTEEIHHFTSENSPLPNNNVITMSIVPETGEVFIGTINGIVSFRGTATEGTETYDNIYAFPNPVKSSYTGPISIKGLIAGSIVKITDIAGNLVFEAKSEGGQLVWDGNNLNGERVASGVYIVFVSTEIGEQKSTTKILFLK